MIRAFRKRKKRGSWPVETLEDRPNRTEALKKDMDEILEEIDGVLEQNAEEFVARYVQRGGE